MAFCAACGSAVEGRFCAKCGAAVGSAASPGDAAPAGSPGVGVAAAGLTDNVAAALCYSLGLFTGILFLVLEPYNKRKNIRFHAFQSIFLNVAGVVASICLNMVFTIIGSILGSWLVDALSPLLGLAFTAVWILMIVWAYQGKTVVVPVIGPLAQKQA